tara:strand:+ start:1145 stop:1756 length:612 start_codon:yes stop_codon:yes gene_type:complete
MSIVTLNDRGVRSVTAFGSLNTGSMVFIKKLTASSSANLSFVNGSSDVVLDSTYKEYLFTFKNIHPATDTADLFVKFRDGSTAYDATITTTVFRAYHTEAGSTAFEYEASEDVAQGTSGQGIAYNIGADNDQSVSGYLHLFNPSSTTFVKHFICRMQNAHGSDLALDNFVAGYCNVTAAIDAVQFVMDTGNIDAGDICLYGIN